MNPHLGPDAASFGEVAAKAFADSGGVDLARRAEVDPSVRTDVVRRLLDQLGVSDLDAAADRDSAEAAAAICLAAGRVVLPYPIVPAVLAGGGAPLALRSRRSAVRPSGTDESSARIDHADLFDTWRVATIDGDAEAAAPVSGLLATRLGPFVGSTQRQGPAEASPAEVALHLTLTGFVIAGALAATVELATAHVVDRVQFDQPLAKFQAVQFQLADAHVAVAGVEEMVQFALWRCHSDPDVAVTDGLAARLAAVDAARAVLRTTQQLHGASGVCDEYDVSVIARHLQPAIRLPFGAETTAEKLATAVERTGFDGLFPHGGAPS